MPDRENLLLRLKMQGIVLISIWLDLIVLRYLPQPADFWDTPIVWASLLMILIVAFVALFLLAFANVCVWGAEPKTLETISSFFRREKDHLR